MIKITTLTRESTLDGQAYLLRPYPYEHDGQIKSRVNSIRVRVRGTLAATFYTSIFYTGIWKLIHHIYVSNLRQKFDDKEILGKWPPFLIYVLVLAGVYI